MANELPEVLPAVLSMPTTGWFCQTGGRARQRVTKNSSRSATEGIYDVKGVPGFTHNSSAVVSVDADYTKYRDSQITVPRNVWSVGEFILNTGLLTDSVEPGDMDERYDRAIEKCVGYISMFPENCTGHIREPTRSISEIRTLVAPKARLETLTYIDDLGGWRVPEDSNDSTRVCKALVSTFPSVKASVLCRTRMISAVLDKDVSPSSLYIDVDGADKRFVVSHLDEAAGTVGYFADKYRIWRAAAAVLVAATAAHAAAANPATIRALASATLENATTQAAAIWDNCVTFTWDPDRRMYHSKEITVVLASVHAVKKTTTAPANQPQLLAGFPIVGEVFDRPAVEAGHKQHLIVTFPEMETTRAFDGYCWLSIMNNENALGFVDRHHGLAIAAKIEVHVVGDTGVQGPFKWVGMPALRIPVGGGFAFPGPDILQEQFGRETSLGGVAQNDDYQHNFYDKFDSYSTLGLLRYHYKQQSAELEHATAVAAPDVALAAILNEQRSQHALDFVQRSTHKNSGLFQRRAGGFQKHLSDKQLYTDFHTGAAQFGPYFNHSGGGAVAEGAVITAGLPTVKYDYETAAVRLNRATTAQGNKDVEVTAKRAEIAAKRLGIGNDKVKGETFVAKARAELVELERDLVLLLAEKVGLDDAVALATIQNDATFVPTLAVPVAPADHYHYVTPFLKKTGLLEASNASIFQSRTGDNLTDFKGSTTFQFPAGQFTAANSFWTALNVTAARSHNFVRLPCTPIMFPANPVGEEVKIHSACLTAGGANFITGAEVFVDIDDIVGDTVTCNFDFTETLSDAQGYDITDGALGHKFFAAGFSLLLGRDDDIGPPATTHSNLSVDYFGLGGGNLSYASANAIRLHFGTRFTIGNHFAIPYQSLVTTHAVVGGTDVVTQLHLRHTMFASSKKIAGLVFIAPAAAGARQQMFIIDNPNTRATVRYTPLVANEELLDQTAPGNTQLDIAIGRPKIVSQNVNAVLEDVPNAVFTTVAGLGGAQNYQMYILHNEFTEATTIFEGGPFQDDVLLAQSRGAVYQSIKRISQHVCGPILNPNARIGAVAPLNYDSRHLPPELRDFRLQFYDIDWSRLQATSTTLNELTLYQFKDGVQKVGAQPNVLYLPQFRETTVAVSGDTFSVEIFSELGAPSYFCIFCRYATTDILQQPQVRSLSIFNTTTKKKSNVVTDLDISQLYHLTQRNVHPAAQYDKHAFRRRQTILLKTEDIGLLGLSHNEYQKTKRVRYLFSGTLDEPGQLYVVMVYNNRGLHIDGRRLQVVTLHE